MNAIITTIWNSMQAHAAWLLVCIVLVTVAMIFDLITGINKAKSNGSATTSSGLRKTCVKAYKYYVPILCGATFDFLFSPLSFYTLPFLAMFITAFCIVCEVKSVFENTRTKDERKDMAVFVSNLIKSKDNSEELLQEIIKNVAGDDIKTNNSTEVKTN